VLEPRFDGFGENSPIDRLQCVSVSVSPYCAYFHLTSPSIELILAKSKLLMGLVTSGVFEDAKESKGGVLYFFHSLHRF
jgi:hypothetical protein